MYETAEQGGLGRAPTQLPRILQDSIEAIRARGLDLKGIFRTSPNVQQLRVARETYERGESVDLEDYGPPVAAGLIKSYLREMPEPLFGPAVLAALPSVQPTADSVRANVLPHLHGEQLDILVALTDLLHQVDKRSEVNGMDARNLATLIAPNTVRLEDPLEEMKVASISSRQSDAPLTVGDILVLCIEQHDKVFA